MPILRCGAFILASWLLCSTLAGQLPSGQRGVLRESRPDLFVIDRSVPGWPALAVDAMASELDEMLLYCGSFQWTRLSDSYSRTGTVEVPRSIEGMRRFVKSGGYELVSRGTNVLLLKEKDDPCDYPLVVSATALQGLGPVGRPISLGQALERRLLQTGSPGARQIGASLAREIVLSTYYWPSAEESDRTFYVFGTSSMSIDPRFPSAGGLLRKVVAAGGREPGVHDVWVESGSKKPRVQYVKGPLANIEIDFDGDRVVDIAAFSSMGGYHGGVAPLRILSGKSGHEIGSLDGYEFVVTEDTLGRKRIRTMKGDGIREYGLDERSQLVLTKRDDLKLEYPGSMLNDRRPPAIDAGARALAEKPVDHFVLPLAPTGIDARKFASVRKLSEIGVRTTLPSDSKDPDPSTHIYVNYRPSNVPARISKANSN